MERMEEVQRTIDHPHMRTQYSRNGSNFSIQFGKPVKLPHLRKNPLNTSRQVQMYDQRNGQKIGSLQKSINKQNKKSNRKIPRFTSQCQSPYNATATTNFDKIDKLKIVKQVRDMFPPINQRLQRIKSQQSIIKINNDIQMIGSYKLGSLIGRGTFSVVRVAKNYKGQVLAIKIYQKSKINNQIISNVRRQIWVMQRLQHPNIVKYYQSIDNPNLIAIVMQMSHSHNLTDYLRKFPNKKLPQNKARPIIKKLFNTIQYIHLKGFAHRDIKLQNILINLNKKQDIFQQQNVNSIKIIDFGFSRQNNQILNDFCGTPHYMSPQIISKGGYMGQLADIWAMGILVFKILVGVYPFRGINDKILYRKIMRGNFQIQGLSQSACYMIRKMLSMDPTQRPTASQLLQYEWINQ